MKIQKFKVIKIFRHTANKEGTPYIDQNTKKPYTRVSIQVDENAISDDTFEGWLSLFDRYGATDEWEEGTEIEGIVDKNDKGDRVYWNLRVPSRFDILEKRVEALEKKAGVSKEEKPEEVKEETKEDELPF